MAEKYIESLQRALRSLQIADHMAYVTYPIVKDKRLLLKVLDYVYEILINVINSVLQHDYLWKKIQLYKDPKSNFYVFSEKCAPRYGISKEQVSQVLDILALVGMHKKSPLEFARKDKIVIMSNSLKTSVIDIEKVKGFLALSKVLIEKASNGIRKAEG